jgi:outer membrane protein assembly factor BamB
VDGQGDISVVWLSTPRMDEDREAVPGEVRALSLAKYGRDGQVRWTREYSRVRVASPRVGASPSGDVFLSANAFLYPVDLGLGEAHDGFVVKLSRDGQPLWQRRVGQKVYGLAADAQGGVFVAAEEWTPEGHLPVLAHHDAEGAFLWTRQLDPVAEGTELHALALIPSGQALLAGRLVGTLRVDGQDFGAPGGRGLVLLAFERDGRLAWGRQVRGVEGHVTGLKPGPDGSVALVGDFRGTLPWGGTTLSGSGAFVLVAGPDGAERWAHPLACGARPAPPVVAVDDAGQVVAVCGGELSGYAPEGPQRDQRTLTPGECAGGDCPMVSTALDFVPGQGLTLAGYQRHGAGEAWNQEAFLRVVTP